MPVHDWGRVEAGVFHHFHQAWTMEITNALNDGLLPADFYALAEQVAQGPIPDVVTLERVSERDSDNVARRIDRAPENGTAAVAVADQPPRVQHTQQLADIELYAARANRVTVRHVSGDEVVGYIEIVSPGNKHSEVACRNFCQKLADAIRGGCHALVIDLQPPTPRDPRGLHVRVWEDCFGGTVAGVTAACPLGLAAYRSDVRPTIYFEPTAVDRILIDMPAFLTPDSYINVPLEATYQAAWKGVPQRWKEVILS